MDIVNIVKTWANLLELPMKEDFNTSMKYELDKLSDLSYDLIYEEMKELETALKTRDLPQILDGMADVTWVIIRWLQEAGIDFYDVFERVATSNFSKMMSEKHYLANKEYYDNEYLVKKIETEETYIFDGEHVIHRDIKYIIYNKTTGKVKKPMTFREPNWDKYTNIYKNDITS